ncbi:MAG: hypothetical protein UT55_C0029G0007, partial [Candidatus Peregrinibacteria bacterium GW2011_GWE2_39_6]
WRILNVDARVWFYAGGADSGITIIGHQFQIDLEF